MHRHWSSPPNAESPAQINLCAAAIKTRRDIFCVRFFEIKRHQLNRSIPTRQWFANAGFVRTQRGGIGRYLMTSYTLAV